MNFNQSMKSWWPSKDVRFYGCTCQKNQKVGYQIMGSCFTKWHSPHLDVYQGKGTGLGGDETAGCGLGGNVVLQLTETLPKKPFKIFAVVDIEWWIIGFPIGIVGFIIRRLKVTSKQFTMVRLDWIVIFSPWLSKTLMKRCLNFSADRGPMFLNTPNPSSL